MKAQTKKRESGIALFFAVGALLLLTVIGASLIFMTNTDTSINSNYRQEQIAYFAAKAGVEEARARMMAADPASIACASAVPTSCPAPVAGNAAYPLFDPAQVAAPTPANKMIYYITNPGAGAAVQPWSSTDAYTDDEICHEGYTGLALTVAAPDVRCTPANLPAGGYVSYTSALPYSGTSGALAYKWVRIAPKVNSSETYLTGTGGSASISTYNVNAALPATNVVCWDGQEELVLNTPAFANCKQMTNLGGAPLTNVYLVTAMGVSTTGARKVVEAEVALQPTTPFPYGLFATSTLCPAITFSGNNPSTDSYTTANNGTYSSTKTNTGGDVGSNGGISVGNGNIGGLVGVLAPPPTGLGTCASPFSIGPNGADIGPNCPGPTCVPNSPTILPAPETFPVPPAPNPLPPNTAYTPPNCSGKKNQGQCAVPGTYGNLTVNGTLTLAPGVYNINSLSMQGNGQIIVNPPGAVTLNVAGTGQANPLAIAGNGITDDTIPNDFTINYAGTGTISIAGNGDVTAILNAPNATVTQQGNGNWYGSILGSKITIGGNAFFHFDKNAALAPNNNGYFQMISFREVPY
jgi:hypothetical protein